MAVALCVADDQHEATKPSALGGHRVPPSVQANQLRFDEQPETEVRFFGEPGHESASGSDRTNLPERVEPGVTYRDVRVDYRLASRLTLGDGGARPAPGDR